MNSEGKINERRLFERYSCCLGGDYSSRGEMSGEAQLKDISASGAALITTKALAIKAPLNLHIITKKMYPLSLKGKVRWCRKVLGTWLMGVAFDQPLFVPLKTIK